MRSYYTEEQLGAIHALSEKGAHLVLLNGRKRAVVGGWNKNPETFDPTHPHAWGHIPGALGLFTVDVDKSLDGRKPEDGATPEEIAQCADSMEAYLDGYVIHACESSPGTGKRHITCFSPGKQKSGLAHLHGMAVGDIRCDGMQIRLEDPVGLLEAIQYEKECVPSYLIDGLRENGKKPLPATRPSDRAAGDNRYSPLDVEKVVDAVSRHAGKRYWREGDEWRVGSNTGSCKVKDDGRYFAFDEFEGGHLADFVIAEVGMDSIHEALNWIEERVGEPAPARAVVETMTAEEEERIHSKQAEAAKNDLEEWMALDSPLSIEMEDLPIPFPSLHPAERYYFSDLASQEYRRKLAARTDRSGNPVSSDQRKRDAEQFIFGVRDDHRLSPVGGDRRVIGESAEEVARLYLGKLKSKNQMPPFRHFVTKNDAGKETGEWYTARHLGNGWIWTKTSLDDAAMEILTGAKGLYWAVSPHANVENGPQEVRHLRPCTARKDGWGMPFAREIAGILGKFAPVKMDARYLDRDKLLLVHPDGLGEHLLEEGVREVRADEYRTKTLSYTPAAEYDEESLPARVERERFPDDHTRLWIMCHRGTQLIPVAFKKAAYVVGRGDAGKTTMAQQDQNAVGLDLVEIGTADTLVRQKAKGKTVDYAAGDTLFESEGKGGVYAEEAGGKDYAWDVNNCKRAIGPGQIRVHAAGKGVKGFVNTATWTLTSNVAMPGTAHAPLLNRLAPTPFHSPNTEIPQMTEILKSAANASMHLRGLIDHLRMVVSRGRLPPLSLEQREMLFSAKMLGGDEDPAIGFLNEPDVVLEKEGVTTARALEDRWNRYCEDRGLQMGGTRSKEFQAMAGEAFLKSAATRINGKSVKVFKGITLKTGA